MPGATGPNPTRSLLARAPGRSPTRPSTGAQPDAASARPAVLAPPAPISGVNPSGHGLRTRNLAAQPTIPGGNPRSLHLARTPTRKTGSSGHPARYLGHNGRISHVFVGLPVVHEGRTYNARGYPISCWMWGSVVAGVVRLPALGRGGGWGTWQTRIDQFISHPEHGIHWRGGRPGHHNHAGATDPSGVPIPVSTL